MRGNVVHKVTLTPHNAAILHHKAALFQYNVTLLADVFLKLTACHKGGAASCFCSWFINTCRRRGTVQCKLWRGL